ncbi:rod shape-determining protein MreC [Paenibacillus oenotherae]|uniref:Cell shape-determining protein MreC n=1 Tax=Paenibacillus oenotherae TaxID=1435645 RepID=A0ABS7D8L1_9BACL|nr:rod shape-determining protein MreC [Paenibacillus oenotherae]MBW7476215.1 rod shape-determining protein MreC [Paenibacillus oenotherae]
MFNWMRNKRMFVLMIVFILFVAVLGFSISDRKKLSWPENFIMDSTGFLQELIYRPAGYILGLFGDLANLQEVYKENEQLRITAAAYARDKINYNQIEQKNIELMEALEFTERQKGSNKYKYLIAQVVSSSTDPYNPTIRINLGSKDGIRTNMVVVTTKGLVGLISRVDPFYSSVMPITELDVRSPDSKGIAATVLKEGAAQEEQESFGIIDSYDKDTGMLMMSKIAESDKLKKGDTIITSGRGNVFPYGMVIGTVENRQVGDFGLTHTATIEPAADFEKLTNVFVVQMPNMEENEQ